MAACLFLGASLLALQAADHDGRGDAGARHAAAGDPPVVSPVSLVVASGVEEAPLHFPQATVGPVLYPTVLPALTAAVEAQTAGPAVPVDEPLTSEQMDALYAYVGVPAEWRADFLAISLCESGYIDPETKIPYWRAYAVGDGGASLGLHQLWHGWALEGEDLMDPITNTWVAVRVREIRGRFGGAGGWSCGDLLGIP